MPKRILVIENDRSLRQMAESILVEEGYEVVAAADDAQGLKLAITEKPQLILLDMFLPGMSGEEVARYLRTDPETAEIALVMLVSETHLDHLTIGSDSPVDDYLVKPFEAADLITRILPLMGRKEPQKNVMSSGNGELDSKMGGGIPLGSLTLIEGSSGAGKSVLTQQMMWGSLNDGFTLSLFTSENSVKSLVKQMRSLDLDILDFILLGKSHIYPVEMARLGQQAPESLIQAMRRETGRDMLIIDSLTLAIGQSTVEEVLGYFEECKRLCATGSSIIVILHSHAVSSELLARIRSLCDAHLQLRTEEVGKKAWLKPWKSPKSGARIKPPVTLSALKLNPAGVCASFPSTKSKGKQRKQHGANSFAFRPSAPKPL